MKRPDSARGDATGLAALLLLAIALLVPTLGERRLADSHEARFAVLARDVLERGALWSAEVGGRVYRNKPPLYPWSIALLSLPGGRVAEATAQAPLVLAAIATVGLTWWLGRALAGPRAAWLAGLALLASFDFVAHSQILFPEMLLTLFTTAALCAFWRAATAPSARAALVAFWTALALAVFAKGPAGLLPLLVAAAWLWSEHGARGVRRLWSAGGAAAFAAITLGWLGPYLLGGGGAFTREVVWADWIDWFVGLPEPAALGRLAGEAALGTLPWTLLLLPAARDAAAARRDGRVRFALLGALLPVALIALSHNPRARYLLPAYPPAAVLLAWWLVERAPRGGAAVRLAGWGTAALAVGVASAPLWLPAGGRHFVPAAPATALVLGGLAVLAGVSLALGLHAGRPARGAAVAAVAVLACYAAGIRAYNAWNNAAWDFRAVGALVARESAGPRAVAFLGRDFYQVDFYAGRPLVPITTWPEVWRELADPARPVVVSRDKLWRGIDGRPLPPYAVLGRLRAGEDEFLVLRGR